MGTHSEFDEKFSFSLFSEDVAGDLIVTLFDWNTKVGAGRQEGGGATDRKTDRDGLRLERQDAEGDCS